MINKYPGDYKERKKCNKCGFEYSIFTIKRHERCCDGNDRRWSSRKSGLSETFAQEDGSYRCSDCGKVYNNARSISEHYKKKHVEGSRKNYTGVGKRFLRPDGQAWNKDLNKETSKSLLKVSRTLKRRYSSGDLICWYRGRTCTEKTRKLLKIKCGGYRRGSGRGKKGWYKGYWCDSSWELAYVIYNLEHNIPFARNTKRFPYEFEGEVHYFIPDFVLPDGSYEEIKGYYNKRVEAKIEYFPHKIRLILEKDLKNVLEYAESKYGKDFTQVYESTGSLAEKRWIDNPEIAGSNPARCTN